MGDVMGPNGLVALALPTRTAVNRIVLTRAPVEAKVFILLSFYGPEFQKGVKKILCIQKTKQRKQQLFGFPSSL